jgi:transcriptional regulator with XRE-family HTH domain
VRDVPQLKLVREDQGWSQRTLAAKSGVAQNTISRLERGERKAMPSTVRKLADALGVEPSILMAQARRNMEEQERRSASAEASRQSEDLRNRYSHLSRQPKTTSALEGVREEFHKEAVRALKEWRETGRWAEFYVSGELAKRVRAFAETHDIASIRFDGHFYGPDIYPVDPEQSEQTYLESIRTALLSVKADPVGDPVAVRSRLFSDDPRETVLAAQLVLDKAKRIVEEHEGYLQSFRRIPERYYAEPQAHSRILKLEEALSKQREAAAEDVRKLMTLYDECLDTLEDQIRGMRKESDALEEFVTQAHDSER